MARGRVRRWLGRTFPTPVLEPMPFPELLSDRNALSNDETPRFLAASEISEKKQRQYIIRKSDRQRCPQKEYCGSEFVPRRASLPIFKLTSTNHRHTYTHTHQVFFRNCNIFYLMLPGHINIMIKKSPKNHIHPPSLLHISL